MPKYYGYEQHPDAHPERPWWRATRGVMERTDGGVLFYESDGVWFHADNADRTGIVEEHVLACRYREAPPTHEMLAKIDRDYPLPAPAPRCGQVWYWLALDFASVLLAVQGEKPCGFVVPADTERMTGNDAIWPPPGAVLVAGPGAPWEPMGEEVEP